MFSRFKKIIAENMTDGAVFGGPTEIGLPLQSGDTYAPGDARIPSSVFGKKKMLSRKGLSRHRKRRK